MRISDWSSDVCSSDLANLWLVLVAAPRCGRRIRRLPRRRHRVGRDRFALYIPHRWQTAMSDMSERWTFHGGRLSEARSVYGDGAEPWLDLSTGINPHCWPGVRDLPIDWRALPDERSRSEEHTSELQSLMRISYAVFCLQKKKQQIHK